MLDLPKVSILIPTLNTAAVLESCLKSIQMQDYPKDKIEIILGDGGSTDDTVKLASSYGARIIPNPLKTGEAGKLVALKQATGEFCALIDSDNILPTSSWLREMIVPLLKHPEAVGSEPWKYTWRKSDSFITRYSALIGMNDPLVHFLGNYDRVNLLTGKWTEVTHEEQDCGEYLLVAFDKHGIPTIGANGTVFRTSFLLDNVSGNYLFDIDILAKKIHKNGKVTFIKVKNGIVHTFCEGDIFKFSRKQRRRIKDFLYHQSLGERDYDWDFSQSNLKGLLKFMAACITVVPLIYQSLKGFMRKPDIAWFFHPLACELTLWEYGIGRVKGFFKKSQLSRANWGQ